MAKIKLHLSSKTSEETDDTSSYTPIKQESPIEPSTKFKIKPLTPKNTTVHTISSKTTKKASKSTLPKIKFKTSSDALQSIKFKPLGETNISSLTSIPNTLIKKRTPTIRVKPARLPGNGYDSEDPDREEDPLIEEAIIIRFLPDEYLDTVRSAVESSERSDKQNADKLQLSNKISDLSNISITWKDKRRAIVKINDVMYASKLVNLPTISEIHKTIDKKNIFKTVDICQMLVVTNRIYDENEIYNLKFDKEYGETYPDGLTPPMEFVKERFDKKYEANVIQNVEDEVAKLLKLDKEAESSVFEFIDADKENITPLSVIEGKLRNKKAKKEKKKRKRELERLQKEKGINKVVDGEDHFNDLNNQFEDIDDELDRLIEEESKGQNETTTFNEKGDVEDNEDEDDDDEDEDEEDEDEEEEEGQEGQEGETGEITVRDIKLESGNEEEEEDDDDEEEEEEEEEVVNDALGMNGDVDESAQHNALLHEEILELESTIAQKEKDLKKAINPIMKNRITDVISRLQQELDIKKVQVAEDEQNSRKFENINGKGRRQIDEEDEEDENEEDDEEAPEEQEQEQGEEDEQEDEQEGGDIEEDTGFGKNNNDSDSEDEYGNGSAQANNVSVNQNLDEDQEEEDEYDDLF
jgi:transcription initiation factor TFIID subunit 7